MKKLVLAILCLAMPLSAQAFSVKIHVFYANLIVEQLKKNGGDSIELIAPKGAKKHKVRLDKEDALAIVENPEYFRGGSVGPDNTIFSGLTDASHGPHFVPFDQCKFLYKVAKKNKNTKKRRQEVAYALGCFLHGATDNVAHHIVNFFSSQTFTMNPQKLGTVIKGDKKGEVLEIKPNKELATNLLNVANHISVESDFQKAFTDAFKKADPTAFSPEKMKHKIAKDLYKKVYLSPDQPDNYFMTTHVLPIIRRKHDAIQAVLNQKEGKDFERSPKLFGKSFEEINADTETSLLDPDVLKAYVQFYKDGGKVAILDGESGLETFDYVLLLPEVILDVRRVMAQLLKRGGNQMKKACSGMLAGLSPKCGAYQYLYKGSDSRMHKAMALKNKELDGIIDAHLASLENMSNILLQKDNLHKIKKAEIDAAFLPLTTSLKSVSRFPREELFPKSVNKVIDNVKVLRELMTEIEQMIFGVIEERINALLQEHLQAIVAELLKLQPEVVKQVRELVDIQREKIKVVFKEKMKMAANSAQMKALERQDGDKELGLLSNIPRSVAHMNAFNTVAGVLANHEMVIPAVKGHQHVFSGPTSFDASYQLEYNQMYQCEETRKIFYPCGVSSLEMIQPSEINSCIPFADFLGDVEADPPIECHAGQIDKFTDKPNKESCEFVSLGQLKKNKTSAGDIVRNPHRGSITLSYPPKYAKKEPVCLNLTIPGIN